MRAATAAEIADHDHDLRKHELEILLVDADGKKMASAKGDLSMPKSPVMRSGTSRARKLVAPDSRPNEPRQCSPSTRNACRPKGQAPP